MNTIISNLSKKGYLYLEIVPGTKNRKAIKLTETGKTYGKKIVSKLYQAELNAFNDLTESEKESFMFVLAKFIHLIRNELNQ